MKHEIDDYDGVDDYEDENNRLLELEYCNDLVDVHNVIVPCMQKITPKSQSMLFHQNSTREITSSSRQSPQSKTS